MSDKPQYLFGMPVHVSSSVPENEVWLIQETWENGRRVVKRRRIVIDDPLTNPHEAKP